MTNFLILCVCIVKRTIIHKYLRFLINFMASKKLSVKILYKNIST